MGWAAGRPRLPIERFERKDGMTTRDVTIGVVGSGGDGVVTLGDLIAQVAAEEGLHVVKTEAYGPQIRGGESSCTVRIDSPKLTCEPRYSGTKVVSICSATWHSGR